MHKRKPRQAIIAKDDTHAFLKQLFASILQTLPTFFYTSPALQHPLDLLVDLIDPLRQRVACFQVGCDAGEMCAKVGFLAMRHRAVYKREPVVELLRGLYGVLGVQRAARMGAGRARDDRRARPRCCGEPGA